VIVTKQQDKSRNENDCRACFTHQGPSAKPHHSRLLFAPQRSRTESLAALTHDGRPVIAAAPHRQGDAAAPDRTRCVVAACTVGLAGQADAVARGQALCNKCSWHSLPECLRAAGCIVRRFSILCPRRAHPCSSAPLPLVAAPGISATPYADNLRYFNVLIEGPNSSPYEGAPLPRPWPRRRRANRLALH